MPFLSAKRHKTWFAQESKASVMVEIGVIGSLLAAFMLRSSQSRLGISNSQYVIPDFQIEDGSSIQIRETRNEFQRQLALKSFSARCIESNLQVCTSPEMQ